MTNLPETQKILADLVGFPTVSLKPNGEIIDYIRAYLGNLGIETYIDPHTDEERFNLFASIGPEGEGGIMLASHLDVVPANAEGWQTAAPFELRQDGPRLIGRGAVDMKGFLACILAMAPHFKKMEGELKIPLHFGLTFDEEEGCFGAEQFGAFLERLGIHPKMVIIGEPTGMKPYVGHKAIMELNTEIRGSSGHAGDPRDKVNALYVASRIIARIEQIAGNHAASPAVGSAFEPPYTTFNVGQMSGGEGRNIVPDHCQFLWEIRPMPNENGPAILRGVQDWIDLNILPDMQAIDPNAMVETTVLADNPGMEFQPESPAVKLIERLWTNAAPDVLKFGTDGCYFQKFGLDTVVFGPGKMSQMHQPEEHILTSEIEECLNFLKRLGDHMTTEAKR